MRIWNSKPEKKIKTLTGGLGIDKFEKIGRSRTSGI